MEETGQERVSTGSHLLDAFLRGGFERDVISTFYGPAGSGKSNICMVATATIASQGKKVVFIDTEGGFSVERIKQLTPDYKRVLANIEIFKPTRFSEQREVFNELKKIVTDDVGLIVVDTISMLYRLEIASTDDVYLVNKELGKQLAYLTEIARKHNVPVLITNQVYANFEQKDKINMVGGDILKYSSKCLVELRTLSGSRIAILKKHRFLPEGEELLFRIANSGLIPVDEQEITVKERFDDMQFM